MSFLHSEVETVFASGRGVAAQAQSAAELAGGFLRSLENAASWVHHPVAVAGIESFRLTWQPVVNEVSIGVEGLGTGTSASAVDVADGDATANDLIGQPGNAISMQVGVSGNPVTAGS
jgi:hypothetical protein